MSLNSACKSFDKRAIIFVSVSHLRGYQPPTSCSPRPQSLNVTVCIVQTVGDFMYKLLNSSFRQLTWSVIWPPTAWTDCTWKPTALPSQVTSLPFQCQFCENSHMMSPKICAFICKCNGGTACAHARDNRLIVQVLEIMRPAEV